MEALVVARATAARTAMVVLTAAATESAMEVLTGAGLHRACLTDLPSCRPGQKRTEVRTSVQQVGKKSEQVGFLFQFDSVKAR